MDNYSNTIICDPRNAPQYSWMFGQRLEGICFWLKLLRPALIFPWYAFFWRGPWCGWRQFWVSRPWSGYGELGL